jgi:hypothetical protein
MELGFPASLVMPGLVPASTSSQYSSKKDVDGRVKPGHDEKREKRIVSAQI